MATYALLDLHKLSLSSADAVSTLCYVSILYHLQRHRSSPAALDKARISSSRLSSGRWQSSRRVQCRMRGIWT